jgi:hypothetical protein
MATGAASYLTGETLIYPATTKVTHGFPMKLKMVRPNAKFNDWLSTITINERGRHDFLTRLPLAGASAGAERLSFSPIPRFPESRFGGVLPDVHLCRPRAATAFAEGAAVRASGETSTTGGPGWQS